MTAAPTLAQVAQAVRAHSFRYATEDDLQRGLHAALTQAGIPSRREAAVAPGCRVDLLCGRVAVEAKLNGSTGDVARQIGRYLGTGEVDGVVLVTARAKHLCLASPVVAVVALGAAL